MIRDMSFDFDKQIYVRTRMSVIKDEIMLKTMKGLDTVKSLSVEVKGSKNPGKDF